MQRRVRATPAVGGGEHALSEVSAMVARPALCVTASLDPTTEWARVALADAPSVCAYHDVLDQVMIENITVHGFRN